MAAPASDWLRHFWTSSLKPLKRIQQNWTGSKISTSSTKFVFFRPMRKQKLPPWLICQKGGTLYSGARYVALWASCLNCGPILILFVQLFSVNSNLKVSDKIFQLVGKKKKSPEVPTSGIQVAKYNAEFIHYNICLPLSFYAGTCILYSSIYYGVLSYNWVRSQHVFMTITIVVSNINKGLPCLHIFCHTYDKRQLQGFFRSPSWEVLLLLLRSQRAGARVYCSSPGLELRLLGQIVCFPYQNALKI